MKFCEIKPKNLKIVALLNFRGIIKFQFNEFEFHIAIPLPSCRRAPAVEGRARRLPRRRDEGADVAEVREVGQHRQQRGPDLS